ncbi:MAG: SDR family NAD(P)-dependent oxidoreductase [Krumholzibacteria bacterium]|nr:SDR family NAD(P)-dependent oxidoreductase [Candidatus Krumholzibacteria bacterium]
MTHTLITGASAGLGLEFARLFAADGHPLVLVARREDRLAALAAALRKDFEVDVQVMAVDLAAPGAPAALAAGLRAGGPGIRHLVNNAGVGCYGPCVDRDPQVYRDLLDLNVRALTDLTRLLLPSLLAAPAGLRRGVLNVASTAAFQPGPLMAVYFASKAYVLSFSEALHEELRGSGVTVTAFCPGPTRTEFFGQEAMIPPGAVLPDGSLDPEALARHRRRDRRRMDPTAAARSGYRGYLAGKAVVIPGRGNALLAQSSRFLPRAAVRRIVHRMMRK